MTAGASTIASLMRQSSPAPRATSPRTAPMMMPPGHQACSTLSLCVFSSGYSVVVSGLITASEQPQPMPCSNMPSQTTV
jgi:hypothetical protein